MLREIPSPYADHAHISAKALSDQRDQVGNDIKGFTARTFTFSLESRSSQATKWNDIKGFNRKFSPSTGQTPTYELLTIHAPTIFKVYLV